MAELVVADSPYTIYPGGVIALRCTDWLAGARGTLSTEADARSITGTVVRDTQTVAISLLSNPIGAFQAADDTLEIDFSLIPELEVDMTYAVFISVLIEGDWDPTNVETYRSTSDPERFNGLTAALGFYGDSTFFLSDSDFATLFGYLRHMDHYWIGQMAGQVAIGDVVGDEVLHWRAYARSGTTVEWLLDQIFLIPNVVGGSHGGWTTTDFTSVGGQTNTFGAIFFGDGFVDGDDGGDDNGEFTWNPAPDPEVMNFTGADGGGDYQRKSDYDDAEYMARVTTDDSYLLANSDTGDEATARAYQLSGPRYRAVRTIVDDPLDRVVAGSWGLGPQQFGWIGSSSSHSMDGAKGIHTATYSTGGADAVVGNTLGNGNESVCASIRMRDYDFSGECTISTAPALAGGTVQAYLTVDGGRTNSSLPRIFIDVSAGQWKLQMAYLSGIDTPQHDLNTYTDISSWWSPTVWIAWRMRRDRYRIRVKVWEAGTSEPGTWDYDDFLPITVGVGGGTTFHDYPYTTLPDPTDVQGHIQARGISFGVNTSADPIGGDLAAVGSFQSWWRNILIEYDPVGDPEDMTAAIEQPDGTFRSEIVVPYGADQLIYWGTRMWTELDGSPFLSFSSRVWNDTAAAELQRAEAVWWHFRSARGGIVSMNWRIADRTGVATRVLVGE